MLAPLQEEEMVEMNLLNADGEANVNAGAGANDAGADGDGANDANDANAANAADVNANEGDPDDADAGNLNEDSSEEEPNRVQTTRKFLVSHLVIRSFQSVSNFFSLIIEFIKGSFLLMKQYFLVFSSFVYNRIAKYNSILYNNSSVG